jgi:hypothetical protein
VKFSPNISFFYSRSLMRTLTLDREYWHADRALRKAECQDGACPARGTATRFSS